MSVIQEALTKARIYSREARVYQQQGEEAREIAEIIEEGGMKD